MRGNNYQRSSKQGSAMVFALVAITVVGLLMAMFYKQSDQILNSSKLKNVSDSLQSKADANYDRVMSAALQAYGWATQVRLASVNLPDAPYMVESWGSEMASLQTAIGGNCGGRVPCTAPDMDLFHRRIFPEARARTEGWRFTLTAQQNGNFETETTDWPKRLHLVVYASDSSSPGIELKVSGQFMVGPTSLSDFSSLAYAMGNTGVVMSEGEHTKVGLFFKLNDENGNPLPMPNEDCRTTRPANPNTPPEFKNFSIYYHPGPGRRFKADMVASNVSADRHCFGLFQTHQWGYGWGGAVDGSGDKDVRSIMVTAAPQQDLEGAMLGNAGAAISRMPAFNAPGGAGFEETSIFQQIRPVEKFRTQPSKKLPVIPKAIPRGEGQPLSLGVVRLPAMNVLVTGVEINPLGGGAEQVQQYGGNYQQSYNWNLSGSWDPIQADLKIGRCASSDATDCAIRYSVTYKSNANGSTYEHVIHEGSTNALPAAFQNTLASTASKLVVSPLNASQDFMEVGLVNITVFTKGTAEIRSSIKTAPAAVDPVITNPNLGGQFLIVNYGQGPAAVIKSNFKTLPYEHSGSTVRTTLGGIRSNSAPAPADSDTTIQIDAGLVAIGNGSRPIVFDAPILQPLPTGSPGSDNFGSCQFNAPQWAQQRSDQLRVLDPSLATVEAGCTKINTRFPPKWERNSNLDIQTSSLLGVTEIGRSYERVESQMNAVLRDARGRLGL